MSANIALCTVCRERIDHLRGTWRHRRDGLPYSPIGGPHMASPPPVPDAVPEEPETAG